MGCAHLEHFVRQQTPIDGILLISLSGYRLLWARKGPQQDSYFKLLIVQHIADLSGASHVKKKKNNKKTRLIKYYLVALNLLNNEETLVI